MLNLNKLMDGFQEALNNRINKLENLITSNSELLLKNDVIAEYERLLFFECYLKETNPKNIIDLIKCSWAVCKFWILKELFI